jgi:hypothetical protein
VNSLAAWTAWQPPLPSPSACCCEAHRCLGGECETFVVCS